MFSRLRSPNLFSLVFSELLQQIFEDLYESEVISEEGFEAWESCSNPAEQEGKGVAIKSTTQFFVWLRTADEEEEDKSDENA